MNKRIKTIIALLSALTLTCGTTAVLTACTGNEPDPGEIIKPITYSVTISPAENGTVKSDKKDYNEGDSVTLTITPNSGYELATLLVDGVDKTSEVVNGKLQVTINSNMSVTATFQEIGPMDARICIAEGYQMAGMTLTIQTEGKDAETVTVGSDNSFSLSQVPYGTVYTVKGMVSGVEMNLGSFTVDSVNSTYKPSSAFDADTSAADFTEGNFTYNYSSKKVSGLEFTDLGENIAEGDAYVAAKIKISAQTMERLRTTGEALFGISMTVGGETCWVNVWLKGNDLENGGQFCLLSNLWTENSCSFVKGGKLTKYGEALINDGLYLVLKYESATGYLHNYIGTTIDDVAWVRSWGTTESGGFDFPANSKLTSFSVGKQSDWGMETEEAFDIDFSNVRYGATLGDALGLEQDVTLSEDSTHENGTVEVSGKPYGNITLTFTPDENYNLTSVKVNGETVNVDGNTYVINDYIGTTIKVEAVFEEILDLESVDVSIPSNVSANGLQLTLTKDGQDTVVTVADGKFTLNNVKVGDSYTVTAQVNGVKTSLGTLRLTRTGNEFDPSTLIGKGNGGTLDLVNGTYTYVKGAPKGTEKGYTFSVAEDISGEVWLATKIQVPNLDDLIFYGNQAIFGYELQMGDISRSIAIRLYNGDQFHVVVEGWMEPITLDASGYGDALKGDGLYFVAHVCADGLLETYLGTSIDTIAYQRNWGRADGVGFNGDQKLVSYGVGFFHEWADDRDADAVFSAVKYGSTLAEAVGTTAE